MTKTLVLVLGMHRSGTSALAGSLAALGLDLGTRLVPPGPDNPKGFFEHDAIWRIHQNLLEHLGSEWHDIRPLPDGWLASSEAKRAGSALVDVIARDFNDSPLWVLKDPRLSRLLPLWQPIWEEFDLQPRIIRLLRHPQEVAASLVRRDGLGPSHALALWIRYTLDAEQHSQSLLRSLVLYPDLLENWRHVFARISQDLNIFSVAEIQQHATAVDAFLDQRLRHHQGNPTEVTGSALGQTCNLLYEELLHQAQAPGTSSACDAPEQQIVDRIALQEQIAHHLQQCQEQKKHITFLQDQQAESDHDKKIRMQELQKALAASEENGQILVQQLEERDRALSVIYHSRLWRWANGLRQVNTLLCKGKGSEESDKTDSRGNG
jgi:hypothetical protein